MTPPDRKMLLIVSKLYDSRGLCAYVGQLLIKKSTNAFFFFLTHDTVIGGINDVTLDKWM